MCWRTWLSVGLLVIWGWGPFECEVPDVLDTLESQAQYIVLLRSIS